VNADGPIGLLCSRRAAAAVLTAELRRRMPHEDLLGVSDDGWAPWARRPGRMVAERVGTLAGELAAAGAKLLILGSLQGTLDGLYAARAAAGVPVIGLEPAVAVAVAARYRPGVPVTVMVEPGSVRMPQLAAALKRVRSGGLPVVEAGTPLPPGVLVLASAGACAAPPDADAVSAAAVAADRAHRLLIRERALARRRRPGRVLAMSSHPAAGAHR
jgi:hypothetical protein